MSTNLWSGDKDGLFVAIEINFPNGEVEIVNGQEKVWEEWRSIEGQSWSTLLHAVVGELDILSKLGLIISSTDWLNAPIDEDKITLIRGSPECWGSLIGLKQDSAETEFSGTILLEKVKFEIWLPNVLWSNFQSLLVDRSGIPKVDDAVLRNGDKVSTFTLGRISFININRWWNESNITNEVFVRGDDA